jgi:hypothetical protein
MVALAKAYQDTDSSHSRTSRLRIIFRLRRNDHFWREADIRRSVRSEECQCARRHHHPKGANNYSGPKLSRTILSFSCSDQRRRVRIHHLEPLDLRTALFTVHKDGSQHQAPTDKAAFSEGIRGASRQNNSIAM